MGCEHVWRPSESKNLEMVAFTGREQQVIRLLVERGLSSKEVAFELKISERTAQVHRNNIMRKLRGEFAASGPLSITDLVLFSIVHGLVDMEKVRTKYGAIQ